MLSLISSLLTGDLFCNRKRRRDGDDVIRGILKRIREDENDHHNHYVGKYNGEIETEMNQTISVDQLFHKKIPIHSNEINFYEQTVNFCKSRNDKSNYPTIQMNGFMKILSMMNTIFSFEPEHKPIDISKVIIRPGLNLKFFQNLFLNKSISAEVIDNYIEIVKKRKGSQEFYIFNTYFYNSVIEGIENDWNLACENLNNWNVNLKNYHRILFPVFILNKKSSHRHWALISVNLKKMKIICYDGMYYQSEDAKNAMKAIAKFMDFYIEFNDNNFKHNSSKSLDSFLSTTKYSSDYQETLLNESFDSEASFDSFTSDDYAFDMTNCNKELNFNFEAEKSTEWKLTFANAPQTNYTDSGVFVCKFIEYLTRNEPILFSKEDSSYFRLLMSNELLENRILTV